MYNNWFRRVVQFVVVVLLPFLFVLSADASQPFFMLFPMPSGEWDGNVIETDTGTYWNAWGYTFGGEAYYDENTYQTGLYGTDELASFLKRENLPDAELIAHHDGYYIRNIMLYPERMKVDGQVLNLTALHTLEGGDDVLLDGGWYNRGGVWKYEGASPDRHLADVRWILLPDSVTTAFRPFRGFYQPLGVCLPDNDSFIMYLDEPMTQYNPGIIFYVVKGSSAHKLCERKGYPYCFRQPYKSYVRSDAPAGMNVFDAERYVSSLSTGSANLPVEKSVYFGSYEQDNNTRNGAEPVEWIVVANDQRNNRALLLSKYVLDMERYHKSYSKIRWDECSVRSWLSDTFYQKCFSASERASIIRTKHYANYGDSSIETTDKVFFLSIDEVESYLKTREARMATPTQYAIAQDVAVSDSGSCYWWLRGSSDRKNDADRIEPDGHIQTYGGNTNAYGVGIRPAIWVSLDVVGN